MTLAIILGIVFLGGLWLCLGLGRVSKDADRRIARMSGREPKTGADTIGLRDPDPSRREQGIAPSRPASILSDEFWDELPVYGHRIKAKGRP